MSCFQNHPVGEGSFYGPKIAGYLVSEAGQGLQHGGATGVGGDLGREGALIIWS